MLVNCLGICCGRVWRGRLPQHVAAAKKIDAFSAFFGGGREAVKS